MKISGLIAAFFMFNGLAAFAQQQTAIGTSTIWGKIDGVAIEGMVQGPSTEVTPLQVACVFEYTEGDIFNSPPALPAAVNGMVHLDHDLKGIITDIRKSGKFAGHAFETLLITPPPGTIAAKKLLLIGLGDRNKFTPDLMTGIASVAVREALRLGVSSYAFASDLKDAGIDSPTALVTGNVVKGTFEAYRTEAYLKEKKMSLYKPLTKVTLLAGPAFYTVAGEGIKEAIATFNN
ncbi:Cytosol aminopeptidase family, N-terminal domain [Chitinophaga sp. CF118]|uniref:M17 family peptidase N-terminal domain-containing protein n=1 Tax=Chitinophaga sp. CF118 TaxID=1884367 RepID=UPI0008EDB628|nr:M17 family peptidase N-terminal domain-containing protein [Chitinophaga sp. CF118]SFD75191.1 Cytosol aminopeptidase family, N-terminal domain [Chitinophaga sp. CF118]